MALVSAIRRFLRPVRRHAEAIQRRIIELPFRLREPPLGSPAWLIKSELKYGGFVSDVARLKVSPVDRRTPEELRKGGMIGGDRMLYHGYSRTYSKFLAPFLGKSDLCVAEFGILKGSGLAIWCDLFPRARVIGFDIDLSHFEGNRDRLRSLGAFSKTVPNLVEYDQLVDGTEAIGLVLGHESLAVVIDDGLHTLDSIVTTWRSVRPHLAKEFVYFIEDVEGLLEKCSNEFVPYHCHSLGMMTVVTSLCTSAH